MNWKPVLQSLRVSECLCWSYFVRTLRMDNICCLINSLLKTFVAGEMLFVETFFPVDNKDI